MIEKGKLLEKSFEECFTTLYRNMQKSKRDYCNIDLDGYTKKMALHLASRLRELSFVDKVIVYRNKEKYKHYHIEVTFNKPLNLLEIILLRILFNDHPERIKLDLLRLLNGFYDWTVDYIGNRKYEIIIRDYPSARTLLIKRDSTYEKTK